MKNKKPEVLAYYHKIDGRELTRVWKPEWPGDIFEMVDRRGFQILKTFLGDQFREYDGD